MASDNANLPTLDDPEQLLAQVIECLEKKDAQRLNSCIIENKIKDQSILWELILKIGDCINEGNCQSEPLFFDVCNKCLLYLIETGNPKETLLAVLEQMDTFIDDVKYSWFLPLIQKSLLKIPSKLFHSLDIALETISAHIQALPIPENAQLEGDEIKAFHMDQTVVRLVSNLQVFLDFLEPFVKAIDLDRDRACSHLMQQAVVLKKHLVQIFDHPLCHLVLSYDKEKDKYRTDSRECAEKAAMLLAHLETNFSRLLTYVESKEDVKDSLSNAEEMMDSEDIDTCENSENVVDEVKTEVEQIVPSWDVKLGITQRAQACIAYLIHCEHLGLEKMPAIFTHSYMLEIHLDLLALLLESSTYSINMKGLLLANSLISLIDNNSINNDFLDDPRYLKIINVLIMIMIKCPVREHRMASTKVFPLLISKFDSAGRYKIYISVLSSCSHSGVKGFLIQRIKDDIAREIKTLKQNVSDDSGESISAKNSHFAGRHLQKLLFLCIDLPDKETSDMLENSEQIIGGLNILRFLVLADQCTENLTGFWSYLADVEKNFVDPLRKGLELSKAHYKLELDNVFSGKTTANNVPEVSVDVGGVSLPSMEKKEKLQLIGKALNTHDMMLGLVARLSELIDQKKH